MTCGAGTVPPLQTVTEKLLSFWGKSRSWGKEKKLTMGRRFSWLKAIPTPSLQLLLCALQNVLCVPKLKLVSGREPLCQENLWSSSQQAVNSWMIRTRWQHLPPNREVSTIWKCAEIQHLQLNAESLKKLVKKKLVNQLDYDVSGGVGIRESCIGGKQCKDSFKPSTTKTSDPLELAHSDVCGRMGKKSIGGAEYFLTLVDDKTHYTWVYPLKTKNRCTTSSGNGKRRLRPGLGNVSTLFEPTTTASTPPKSYRHISRPAGSDMNWRFLALQNRMESLNDSIGCWWRWLEQHRHLHIWGAEARRR